jgi:FtsP/CotA-like multicopper oxidase with cupredoxin domain
MRTRIGIHGLIAASLLVGSSALAVPPPDTGTWSPLSTPDYFGVWPNYASSPLPYLDTNGNVAGGMRKFQDALPDLRSALAQPEPCAFPDPIHGGTQQADCYTIKLKEVPWQFHADLPATRLRGYVQVLNGQDRTFQYLGPVILASKDKPVRVTFINALPTGAGGDLFIPTDTTYMGAGLGPDGVPYSQNRATIHLHGGTTPWISDGTIHQWTTPPDPSLPYPKGVSVYNVPDMPNPGTSAIQGTLTFYYTNEQSARLMFYHDHALGITRLNVYAGEAAGYLLTDPVEGDLITRGVLPKSSIDGLGLGVPLVIQDRTFVPESSASLDPRNTSGGARPFTNLVGTFPSQLEAQDPTWDTAKWGGFGSLWYPHVYMPNQNPGDLTGANAMGRWDYGPWFWPPFTTLTFGPVTNPYFDPTCVSGGATYCEGPEIPGTPDSRNSLSNVDGPSGVPEAFMDTPVVNGKAYPTLTVPAGKVRFRILNAANDRFFNLSLWVADPSTVYPPGYTGLVKTEVKMVPFDSTTNAAIGGFPAWWYDASVPNPFDGRTGGVPDPATRGPAWIQIGTEGGFLPAPAVILNQPVNYVMNKRDITVGNVREKALFLGPAERADVVVDFTNFAGRTLILYNDSPAPVPAADPRLDYFTGNLDSTDTGGTPSTLPGFGPNTRTIMRITVEGTPSDLPGPVDDYDATYLATLAGDTTNPGELPKAFAASQDPIIVPQAPYDLVYGKTFPGDASAYVKIQDTSFKFRPLASWTTSGPGSGPCSSDPTGCVTLNMYPKAIIEDFQIDYGRMNAILGNEIANTNVTNQTSIPQTLVDPPVEMVKLTDGGVSTSLIGSTADGTQLWKVTHNGVDTHAIHFHMFNVQVVNRVGWDGAIKPPDANELGFKDTVRMNPLEDIVVATRPIRLKNLPFKLPNSIRLLDPTMPPGSPTGFTNVDPQGNPVTVLNQTANFGWEYVYHCHLLGHEENDMMRPLVVAAPPEAPVLLSVVSTGNGKNRRAVLSWTDSSLSANGWRVERATDPAFATNLTTLFPPWVSPAPATWTYTDPNQYSGQLFYYRVVALNTVGSSVPGYPTLTANSNASNVVAIGVPAAPAAPTNLIATILSASRVQLNWTNNATNATSILIERMTNNNGTWVTLATLTATTTTTYTDATVTANQTFSYRVSARNAGGTSGYAGPVSVTMTVPAAVTGFTATAAAARKTATVTLAWSPSAGAATYTIDRATNASFTGAITTSGITGTTLTQTGLTRATPYYYRIRAVNGVGASAPANATPFPVTSP